MENKSLRTFLELPYDELEETNLEAKRERLERVDPRAIEEKRRKYLTDEKRIKAVTVCFSDVEGRFHMLDYDKKFLLPSADNLTFDGSSIRGFSGTLPFHCMLIARVSACSAQISIYGSPTDPAMFFTDVS